MLYLALTVMLLAAAAFSVIVVRRPRSAAYDHDPRLDLEQVQGFIYVGAAVLVLISIGTVLLGVLRPDEGKAEALAVLGFIGYALYLTASAVVLWVFNRPARSAYVTMARWSPPSSAPPA